MNYEKNGFPKAYLPAGRFDHEEIRFVDLVSDLLSLKLDFSIWHFIRLDDNYVTRCQVDVSYSDDVAGEVRFRITPHKRFRSIEQTESLVETSWAKSHSTSVSWTRSMYDPSASIGANHLVAGVRSLVGFDPNSGFKVRAKDVFSQPKIDQVLNAHNVWGVPAFGDLRFLTI
jgi:hypothetical protein